MKIDQNVLIKVKKILEGRRGKTNAIPTKKLAYTVGIEPGPSNVKIRYYVTEVIKTQGLPIGSAGNKGYYLIDNEKELDIYVKSLEKRMKEIQNRIVQVSTNFMRYREHNNIELSSKDDDIVNTDDNEPEDIL